MELRKLKDKATEAFTKGRFSKAAELYEEYCRADPKDHQSRLRTGDAWAKAGQRERAIAAYQSAAEGFAKEGFLPRAIAASKLILELDPAHRGVQQMLADLYARRSAPAGARARGPMGSALTPPPAPEPTAKSRLPEAVRAAVAEIKVDVDVDAPETPVALEAGGAPVDLSSELPPELSLNARPASGEVVVHSVSVGTEEEHAQGTEISLDVEVADEPILVGEPVEAAREAEPVIIGEALPPEADSVPPSARPAHAPVASGVEARGSAVGSTAAAPAADASTPPSAPRAVAVTPPEPASTSASRSPVADSASAPPAAVARPATSSLPPGLAPRSSQRIPVPEALRQPAHTTPVPAPAPAAKGPISGKWKALASPISDPSLQAPGPVNPPAPSAPEAPVSAAPPGLRPRRVEAPAPTAPAALPFRELAPDLDNSLRPAAVPTSFTELELEGDSLLHAVELAAQAGLSQRTALAVPATPDDDEEVYSLTEEVGGPEGRPLDELPTVPLFSDLPRDAFIELFERCPLRRFGPGERIIEQGTRGDAFYVICEGAVRVFRVDNGEREDLATLEGGACFGEMALLSGAPRTASVEGASEDTQLLEISAPVLAELSRRYPLVAKALKKFVRQRMLTNVMNTSALFRPFNRKDRRTLVERFRARDVERDAVIIRDGGETDGLYVVLSGEVEVSKDGLLLTRLKEGDLFGEISLLQKTPATATVTATRHTTLLRLPREDFDALISSHPQILVLVSELSDARLLRTRKVLGAATSGQPTEVDEELILV
ncbi:cyclic nucleotide-binding domain-containing protein [Pyxidicoccus fallax]|uniref:Cyclic nucleotide-binding domain-containing protein n=1 Tax=Pyxidicoccus fallax TaxID=394095 RepID=A0A848LWH0_9BACT|nr:cyclic nucleotide-binding domain-containing protein [Pyxidicoccus fallax]NMO22458.1 cyclic nucleotide-binding domain-containing protein [Pyxidicoccus fallax]NPC84629.1 cyclic nucleotide-binding domain-containing protein [Pyxidicoccus fallax]